jgi:hypothetical protein
VTPPDLAVIMITESGRIGCIFLFFFLAQIDITDGNFHLPGMIKSMGGNDGAKNAFVSDERFIYAKHLLECR